MKATALIALFLLATFAGCLQESTTNVTIVVRDEQGKNVQAANVSARIGYTLKGNPADWLAIDGTIVQTAITKSDGIATMQLIADKYAFIATTGDGKVGGSESGIVLGQNKTVEIVVKRPAAKTASPPLS